MHKFKYVLIIMLLSTVASADDQWIAQAYYKSFDYEQRESYSPAIKALSQVYAEYPNTYTVNLRMGWLFYLQGKYTNSISHYRAAIKVYPDSAEPKLGLMLPLLAQHKYADVEALATQAMRIDPYNYYANLRAIIALQGQQKYDSALQMANKMLAQYPTDVLFLEHAAILQNLLGKTDAATRLFEGLRILDPENASAKTFFSNQG